MFTFAIRIEMFVPRVRPYPDRQLPDEIIKTIILITEVFAEYFQNYDAVYFGKAPSPYGCVLVSAFSMPNEEHPHCIR